MTRNNQVTLCFAIPSLFFACVMISHTVFSFPMTTPCRDSKWFDRTQPKPNELDEIATALDIPIFLGTEGFMDVFYGIESRWKTIGLLSGITFSKLHEIEYMFSDDPARMTYLAQIMQSDQVTFKQLALAIYMPCGGNSPSKAQHLIMQQTHVTSRYATALLTRLNRDFLNHLPKKSNYLAPQLNNVLNAEMDLASIYYQLYEKRFQANDILMKLDSQCCIGRSEYYNTPNKKHLLLLNGLNYILRQGQYSWSDIIQAVLYVRRRQ